MLIQSYVCKRVFSFFSPYVRDYRHISFTRLKYFWGSMIIFILSTSKHGPAQDHGAEAAAEAGGRGARGAEANKKKDAAENAEETASMQTDPPATQTATGRVGSVKIF